MFKRCPKKRRPQKGTCLFFLGKTHPENKPTGKVHPKKQVLGKKATGKKLPGKKVTFKKVT